jgi:thymidylate synthase (FAD)
MEIVKPSVELLSITTNALGLIEMAGRTCYQSEADDKLGPEPFVRKIIQLGHESVIEHASATFRVITDRGVTHEFVRHRLYSYSQESTRYVNYKKGIKVIEPPSLTEKQREYWAQAMQHAEMAYSSLIELGQKPQIARAVLPTCLKTAIVCTANFREWRHFLHMRTAPAAHPQMRGIAKLIEAELVKQCLVCFEDIGRCYPDDGTPSLCRYCRQPIKRG